MNKYSVAVDGPAGAGKSTISKLVAKRLGLVYIDTGAMYRAVALYAINNNINTRNSDGKLAACLDNIDIEIKYVNSEQHIFLNGRDVNGEIRTPEVSMGASDVATVAEVREKLVELQRNMAKTVSVIMDGRDIGTHVLKNAEIKIFLSASVEVRAKRRYNELMEKGESVSYEDVVRDIIARDENDSTRKVSPLRCAEDAYLFDNGEMNIEESAEFIINYIKDRLG